MTDRWGTFASGRTSTLSEATSPSRRKMLIPPQVTQRSSVDIEGFSKFVTLGSPQIKNNTQSRSELTRIVKPSGGDTSGGDLNTSAHNQSKLTGNQQLLHHNSSSSQLQDSSMFSQNKSSAVASHKANNSSVSSAREGSFFFTGPARFEENENLNYFDHSMINPLVDAKRNEGLQSMGQFDRINEKKPQLFNSTLLRLSSESLAPPKAKLKQLEDVRENQRLFKQWRTDHQEKSRAYKLVKGAYRSGITSVDGPMEAVTDVYKKEHTSMQRRDDEEQARKLARLHYIEKYVATNPTVVTTVGGGSLKQHKKDESISAPTPMFERKAKNAEAQQSNTKSFDRIFGHNLTDQRLIIASDRSKYLYAHDVQGKTQNIISNTLNTSLSFLQ